MPGDPALPGGRVALVDERHDLIAEVVHVAAGPRGVDELGAAEGSPRVYEHDDRRRALAGGEHRVDSLDDGGLTCLAREPGVELAAVALSQIHRRNPSASRYPGRAVHGEG